MKIIIALKNHLRAFMQMACIVFAILFASCSVRAQVSTRVEEVNGIAYYIHTVEKGQTLYSLSKLYQCDINEITAANPGTDQGIKDGSEIRIPASKAKVKGQSIAVKDDKTFLLHQVKKKETLYSIAKLYAIDINELTAANPGSDAGVKKGQELRIPVKSKAKPVTTDMHSHTVAQGETLYGISKAYGLTVEAIQNANGGLKEGLKAGQVIMIPVTIGQPVPANPVGMPGKGEISPVTIVEPVYKEKYDIALMLPFYLNYKDTMEAREKKMRDVALQMYRGAMMAGDTLEANGLKANIHIYDVLDGKSQITEVLARKEMLDMDVVIGPTFKEPLADACIWGAKNGVHVVCPVQQPNKVLLNSPNMSKAVPSSATQWVSMARLVYKKHANDNIIIIDSKNIDDRRSVDAFREEWRKLSGDSLKNVVIVADAGSFTVKDKYVAGKKNIVLAPTSDKKVIATLFRSLGDGDITVYGTESWDDLDAITVANRNKYHVHYPQTTFIDYDDAGMQKWIEAYRKKYKSEPGKFAVIGYDLVMYYGTGLKQYGRAFPNHLEDIKAGLYGNGYDYFKTSNESGFENQYIILVGVENYQLVREN